MTTKSNMKVKEMVIIKPENNNLKSFYINKYFIKYPEYIHFIKYLLHFAPLGYCFVQIVKIIKLKFGKWQYIILSGWKTGCI